MLDNGRVSAVVQGVIGLGWGRGWDRIGWIGVG